MCGRYALTLPPDVLAALLQARVTSPDFAPRYNIAPTQPVLAARSTPDGGRELTTLRWGLIPFWANDASIGSRMINARSETVAEKPVFREALTRRRCVIPASGFYEWKRLDSGRGKQPYYITRSDGAPMIFAGLWESWRDRQSNDRVESCTILTTEPNALLRELHDRMPVVLDEPGWTTWLDPDISDPQRLTRLLTPMSAQVFAMHPVSRRVNTTANDEASLIERTAIAASPEGDLFSSAEAPSSSDRRPT